MHFSKQERRHFLAILAPMVSAIGLLVAVCVVGLQIASIVRAYVGGESLWSKGRSEAVAQLRQFAQHGLPLDYKEFRDALAVPLGDRQARLELDKADPSTDRARAGFLQGGNSPDDVSGLIRGYLAFRHVSFMQRAIAAWAEGDRLIAQLQDLGERLREFHGAGRGSATPDRMMDELERINIDLLAAEKRFSETLGDASRAATSLLICTSLALGLLVAVVCTWFVRRTLQRQLTDQRLLAEANKRWELAAEADGIGMFEWHVRADRFELDHRGRALYGFATDSGAPQRMDIRALHHPADMALVREAMDEALKTGAVFRARYRVRDAEIGWRHVEATGQLRRGDEPHEARMVGVVRDITVELTQAQLRADKELAERTAAARMAFLSRLSHELRTPLNAILGLAHLLAVDTRERLTANQARRVRLLMESGRNLLRLVEDVLDISHIDAGKLQVANEETDLVEVLRTSLPLVAPERALRSVTIAAALPDHPLWVMGDAQRLQQVFVNLLSNACKYNRPEGVVTLGCHERGDEVWVSVTDEGKGLSESERAELFQAFKRLSPSPDIPGSGVGLMVVQMLVEQMKGRIDVQSEVGEGSCFTVVLRSA